MPALDQLTQDATGARVFLDQEGALHWPVLLLYPEHQQSDFISAFCEASWYPLLSLLLPPPGFHPQADGTHGHPGLTF